MQKIILLLLIVFQFQCLFGQKTLQQIIDETPFSEDHYSPFSYYDSAEKKQGSSIQEETNILKKLELPPLEHSEYYITGKYEINNLIVLFFSNYWDSEDIHFAILLDTSLQVIDRIDETAYENAEGFYSVNSWIDYNILTINSHNIYNNPEHLEKKYSITNKGFKPIKDSQQALGNVADTLTKRHIEMITNEYKVIIDEISIRDFKRAERRKKNKPVFEKVTDIKKIKTILNKQLIGKIHDDGYFSIEKILTDSGEEISAHFDECGIIAYYPKYHYLLLECGHSSDYLIDLKNGEDDINRIGNPDYYTPSPQNIFRLNGYYSGQSNIHFLEKNTPRDNPEYLLSMSGLLGLDYIENYFWIDDTTLLLKIEEVYYKMQLEEI